MRLLRSAANFVIPKTPWGDALFSTCQALTRFGRIPAWRNPRTFSDHLFAMKLNGELYNPLRQYVTDKLYAKDYIANIVGDEYILEPLAVLSSESEIDAFKIPGPCMVKPTHLSGRHLVVHDVLDKTVVKRWMRINYYHEAREPNYRYLKPKILVEEIFADSPPCEFKVYCVNGRAQFINSIRGSARQVYSTDWKELPFYVLFPPNGSIPKPQCAAEIVDVANRLAREFDFIRVDFLVHKGRPKVCELTNLPNIGIVPLKPPKYDLKLGGLFQ